MRETRTRGELIKLACLRASRGNSGDWPTGHGPCDPNTVTERHLVTIEVAGRPATFATAHERPWKEAVRAAIAATGVKPQNARFAVQIDFRLAAARNANEVWDLDNLIKPTLDAMEGVFGSRAFRGSHSLRMTE